MGISIWTQYVLDNFATVSEAVEELKKQTFRIDAPDMPNGSANLSITKEIGDHVSVSFYANNFTNSRPFVASYATGVKAVFTPDFYYGLTVRLKF